MRTLFPELDEPELDELELAGEQAESGERKAVPTFRNCPILEPGRDSGNTEEGWWFGTPFPDWPQCGPYSTRKECEEARGSFVRNWIGHFQPREICTSC